MYLQMLESQQAISFIQKGMQGEQCFSNVASLRGMDFNSPNSLVGWMAWEFWELKSTRLKTANVVKHWYREFRFDWVSSGFSMAQRAGNLRCVHTKWEVPVFWTIFHLCGEVRQVLPFPCGCRGNPGKEGRQCGRCDKLNSFLVWKCLFRQTIFY